MTVYQPGDSIIIENEEPTSTDVPVKNTEQQNKATMIKNPMWKIWLSPRSTMRSILDTNPNHCVLALVALYGIARFLNKASIEHLNDTIALPVIMVLAVLLGPLIAIVQLYISSSLIALTGQWIGGKGDSLEVRTAIAWSYTPIAWCLLLWIPRLMIFGTEPFRSQTPTIRNPDMLPILIGLGAIELTLGIWAVVLYLKCLAEAQGFSVWKAIINTFLPLLVVLVMTIAILIPVGGLFFLLQSL